MSKLVYGKILLLMALALLVACRKEKNSPSDVPAIRTVHYKASIQTGPDTRATVGNDLKYMFEAGDKVYMESADGKLYGFLSMVLPTGAGDNVALFEGDLTYAGDTPFPNDNPSVNLVLVSKEDAVHTVTDGRLNAVSYSSDTWAPTLEAAVSHMSHFTGSGHFDDVKFTLQQQSSFLKCAVKMQADQAPLGSTVTARLLNNSVPVREISVKVNQAGSVPFVFAFPGNEVLESAKLEVEWSDAEHASFDVADKQLAPNTYYSLSRTTFTYDGFRIRAIRDNTVITFNYNYEDSGIQYSLDYGENWINYTTPFELAAGDVACIRGNRVNYKNAGKDEFESAQNKPIFAATKLVYISGNIMSLLADKENLTESAFHGAFSKGGAGGGTQITYIDIDPDSPLILPATNLAPKCYAHMFRNCTSLTRTPEFRVESTAERCCYNMFRYCSKLEDASGVTLPAMTLSTDCYRELFRQCSKLKTIPVLPASTLVQECYRQMLSASGVKTVVCLATDISALRCLDEWMSGVPAQGTFYKAPGVEVNYPRTAHGIPSGWTVVDYPE